MILVLTSKQHFSKVYKIFSFFFSFFVTYQQWEKQIAFTQYFLELFFKNSLQKLITLVMKQNKKINFLQMKRKRGNNILHKKFFTLICRRSKNKNSTSIFNFKQKIFYTVLLQNSKI